MSETMKPVEATISEPTDIDVSMNLNQSFSDEARMREAELNHDLASQKLDFEKERYYNSIPKSDKELELEYAYKNRLLDKRIADEAYKRSPEHKREVYSLGGAILLLGGCIARWLWSKVGR